MKTQHETEIQVDGMTCGSCVRHVEQTLRSLPGVANAEVRLREKYAIVRHDPSVVPVAALVAAIENEGYSARVA